MFLIGRDLVGHGRMIALGTMAMWLDDWMDYDCIDTFPLFCWALQGSW